jgi:hypothetical protein
MATFWSNPTPDLAHTAAAMAPESLHFADIGPVVGAIMRMKEQQAHQKAQDQKDMIEGIGKVAQAGVAAYGAYSSGKSEGAMADYLKHYQEAQASGTPGGMSQAMSEDMQRMTAEDRIKVAKWQITQSEKNAPPSFASGPGGTQFLKTKEGYHQVSGPGSSRSGENQVWSEELNSFVPPATAAAATRQAAEGKEKEAKESEAEFKKTYPKVPKSTDVPAPEQLAEGKGYGYVYKNGKLVQASTPEEVNNPDRISPYEQADVDKGAPTYTPGEAVYFQQKKADIEAKKSEAEELKKKIYAPRQAKAGVASTAHSAYGDRPGKEAARLEANRAMNDGQHDPAKVKQIFESTYGEPL